MNDDTDNANGAGQPSEGGIFGKLPDSRPGTRSPRRRSPGSAKAEPKREAKPKQAVKPVKRKPVASPKPPLRAAPSLQPEEDAARVASASSPDGRPADPPGDEPGPRSLEDVAWAGVAAAAEAATLGVRIANKAIEAFRGTSERR